MPGNTESNLSLICEEAKKLGAADALAFAASEIVVDPRARLKCQVPICARYGNNLMCPPYVMPVSEFQEALSRYSHAILVQFEVSVPEVVTQGIDQEANLAAVYENRDIRQSWSPVSKEFGELIGKIEAFAFSLGYSFAAGFGGPCMLCDECVASEPGKPCRYPFVARPSMQAVGIDVFRTAERAGVACDAPANDRMVIHGLVLVD